VNCGGVVSSRKFGHILLALTEVSPLTDDTKRPTIVLFDLDGTLVHHVNPRVLQALEFLDDCSHRTGRLVARFRLHRRNMASESRKAPKLLVHRAIHKVRRKSVEEMLVPCSTMRTVLEKLHAEGVTLGVVSNGLGRGYGHDVLEAFDLRKYFSACVFREDVARGKPWPDSIVTALHGIGRDIRRSDEIWYIGDQRKDIGAAFAASAEVGKTIRSFALGARAALCADPALAPSQIMWTPSDFERTISALFPRQEQQAPLGYTVPAALL
jgi:phosphoglycolate phosphatase